MLEMFKVTNKKFKIKYTKSTKKSTNKLKSTKSSYLSYSTFLIKCQKCSKSQIRSLKLNLQNLQKNLQINLSLQNLHSTSNFCQCLNKNKDLQYQKLTSGNVSRNLVQKSGTL